MPLRISMDWLREHIDLPERGEDLAELLTLSGTEVEQVVNLGTGWEGILVVRVAEVGAIPGADRVRRAVVDTGDGPVEVVSAAPNLREGDFLPWAPPGTRLPNGMLIGERKFRGALSVGMLLSPVELGISAEADGLMVLGTSGTPGQALDALMPPDQVLVVEVTTNRPDLLCHLGIARELSALLDRPLRDEGLAPDQSGPGSALGVRIEEPGLCARYQARWLGSVTVAASPPWLQRRLRAVGQKPINNVVDAGNYVMFDTGQPLHAFDADRIDGGIIVRRARAGESIACLDGVTRDLTSDDLVIADERGPVAIAGVIGGSESAVSATTTNVLLESASFTGTSVRNTSRRLGVRTEASTRFEKQLSPLLVAPASAMLAGLVQTLAGAGPSSPPLDVWPRATVQESITLRPGFVARILGVPIQDGQVAAALRSLRFQVEDAAAGLEVVPPPFRADVHGDVDLVEEVGRLRGYNSLPSTLPGRHRSVGRILPPADQEWVARDVAAGAGYDEAITPSFASPEDPAIGAPDARRLRLLNPMARDQGELRESLTWGLARAVARNAALGTPGVRLYEIGRVFRPMPGEELPDEPRMLAAAIHLPPAVTADASRAALLALKGLFDAVASAVSAAEVEVGQAEVPGLHPGRGAHLSVGGIRAGHLGELHPGLARLLDIAGAVVIAEVNFDALVASPPSIRYRVPSRFPAVARDMAVTVPELTPARDVVEAVLGAGEVILRTVELFDEYRGAQVGVGQKSLTFHLGFQLDDRTLTGEEVALAADRVAGVLRERFGALIRD